MAEQKTKQRRIWQSGMSQREAQMLRAVCSSLASYRRSMFFRWLILTRVHKSRLSTLFPAIASLSTTLNLSSTAGTWEKLLKESPRLLSWNRPPISSGRELRWFPSKDSVCRLRERKGQNSPLLSFTLESGQNICSQQFVFVAIIYCTAT